MKLPDRRTVLRWLVPALLAASVLASPGLERVPLGLLGLFAVTGSAVLLFSIRSFSRWPLVVLFGLAACAATALQLVPLPAVLVSVLAPKTFEFVSETRALLGEAPAMFLPLSADPHSTAVDLGKFIALTALAVCVARFAASKGSRTYLLKSVAAVGLGTGACAVLNYTPLVNPNHLSALLIVTASVCTALAARAMSSNARLGWAMSAGFSVTLCLLLRSRAAVLLLGISALLLCGLLVRRRLKRGTGHRPLLIGIFVAACFLSMVAAFTGDELAQEFAARPLTSELSAPEGRFALWKASWELVAMQPLTGVGHGAFESTMAEKYGASHVLTYSFVENEYLQAVIDWGVPLGLLLGGLFLWTVSRALRRGGDDTLAAGAAVGLFALVVHAIGDFGLETPGLAATAIVLLCVLDRPELKTGARFAFRKPVWAAALIAVTAILFVARPLREDRRALAAVPDEARARAAMTRHPADFLAPAVVATRRFEAGDPRGFAFANHALLRQPTNPHMHHLVARMLFLLGRKQQACVEYRLAGETTPSFAAVMEEVVARYPDPKSIATCLPLEARPPVNPVAALAGIGQGPAALLLARRAREVGGGVDPLTFAELEVAHGDPRVASETVRELLPVLSGSELARAARVVLRAGDSESALREFERALTTITEPKIRAQIFRERALLLRARGLPHQAAWEEARAKELSP